jgi:hypothetical protein
MPKFLEPHEYVYKLLENATAFTGDEVEDESASSHPQCGDICYDGGSYPSWAGCNNASVQMRDIHSNKFTFKFRPPKLTACKILSTDIAKMKVDNVSKYLVIMIREGKFGKEENYKTFKFLTAYDSRSVINFTTWLW